MKKNILIIEDKKVHMETLCRIIGELEENIEIYPAYNVAEAYRIAMERKPYTLISGGHYPKNGSAGRCCETSFCSGNARGKKVYICSNHIYHIFRRFEIVFL